MQDSILKFSNEELAVLSDRNFFQLKHSSTAKLVEIFGRLEIELKKIFLASGIQVKDLNTSSGKIFRGENYRGFPYVLLDCPRLFTRESVFAFRTMFWWGNEFTFTLHIQGEALEKIKPAMFRNLEKLKGQGILFCINKSPWQYHLGDDNYISLDEDDNLSVAKEIVKQKEFVKISRKLSVEQYERVLKTGEETLKLFLSALKD